MKILKKQLRKQFKLSIIFLVQLFLFISLFFFLDHLNLKFDSLQKIVAKISYNALKNLKYNVNLENFTIIALHKNTLLQFEISPDSTGWKGIFLISALVLSTPAISFRRKTKHLIFFLPIVFLINLFRIISTILIGLNFGLKAFDFWHSVLWSYGFLGIVIALWSVWVFLCYAKKI